MKVGLDATPLTEPTGGISRYTTELARSLVRTFPDDEYWLLSDQDYPRPEIPKLRSGAIPRTPLARRWWLFGLPREISRIGIGVFHGTGFSVPYIPACPSVLTLHDLSPWMNPDWHNAAGRVRQRTPMLLKLGLATLVLTPSKAIRRQAMEQFHLSADRIVSVAHAASPLFRPVDAPPPDRPYFLYVGTLEPRKNLSLLVEAWRELRQNHDVDLVLAGRRRDGSPELAPEPGLRILGPVPDEDLPGLYSGCIACVYPSLYEGFGLPVLEAMQCGAAVITSLDPAIIETAGGAAIALDVHEPRRWVEAMTALLANPAYRADFRARALQRAGEFSWAQTARETREVYAEAARRFRRRF